MTDGQLNPLSIYVLSPGDPRQINVDNMEAEARNWLAQHKPGFISSGGQLSEFTPVGGNMWRAYGELNGRVVYLLDIDATGTVSPVLTSVPGIGGTGAAVAPRGRPPPSGASRCPASRRRSWHSACRNSPTRASHPRRPARGHASGVAPAG